MEKIVIASNNKHKIEEFKKLFKGKEVLTMNEIGFLDEIEETGTTFFENSLIKAQAVYDFCKKKEIKATILADDSGLCVNALNGAPGVYSARYAGNHDTAAARKKLLKEMKNKKDRSAFFQCVIVMMYPDGSYVQVDGKTFGKIADKEYGNSGFAFDPVFFSDDLQKTFGQATMEEKNSVSHRAFEALKKVWKN